MRLTRETILALGRAREIIEVPEWGGAVIIATLNLAERLEFERWSATLPDDSGDYIVGLLAYAVVDDNGQRLFTQDDIKALADKSAAVLLRLSRVAQRLNRLGDAEVVAAQGES